LLLLELLPLFSLVMHQLTSTSHPGNKPGHQQPVLFKLNHRLNLLARDPELPESPADQLIVCSSLEVWKMERSWLWALLLRPLVLKKQGASAMDKVNALDARRLLPNGNQSRLQLQRESSRTAMETTDQMVSTAKERSAMEPMDWRTAQPELHALEKSQLRVTSHQPPPVTSSQLTQEVISQRPQPPQPPQPRKHYSNSINNLSHNMKPLLQRKFWCHKPPGPDTTQLTTEMKNSSSEWNLYEVWSQCI
jgi:hypothetical protein